MPEAAIASASIGSEFRKPAFSEIDTVRDRSRTSDAARITLAHTGQPSEASYL